jgi:hypothetical protein
MGEETCAELLANVLTSRDLEAIEHAPLRERSHPVRRLLRYRTSNGCEYHNTTQALRTLLGKDRSWLKRQARRLADTEDYTEPASALAEIRAYGYLAAAGFCVNPVSRGSRSTVDLRVFDSTGLEIEVEVFAKHLEQSEADSLSAFHHAQPPQPPSGGISVREHVIIPMGRPRPGESVTQNAISKLAQIKGDEKQFSGTVPAVLWVDGQDETLSLFPWQKSAQPLVSDRAGFHSGDVWYACYGKKELPIFERYWPGALGPEGGHPGYVRMGHSGRFIEETKLSCIVVAAKSSTYAMENPSAQHRLSRVFWRSFSRVRHFDIALSWLDWPEGRLRERLEVEYQRIGTL